MVIIHDGFRVARSMFSLQQSVYKNQTDFYHTSFPVPRDEIEQSVQILKLHRADFEHKISSRIASAMGDKSK